MEVSVKTLKNELSKYLRLVAEGNTITILSHNKPVATLSAPVQLPTSKKRSLKDIPGITWSGKKFMPKMPTVVNTSDILLSDIIVEERG